MDRAGTRIPLLRKAIGLSQGELASYLEEQGLGGSQQQVSKLERGIRVLRPMEVEALCAILGVEPETILEGTVEEEIEQLKIKIADHNREATRLRGRIRKLRPRVPEYDEDQLQRFARLESELSFHTSLVKLYESRASALAARP
jgi:transcriptional regulator with XRE-family HTH domain